MTKANFSLQQFYKYSLAILLAVIATALQIWIKPFVEQVAFILLYPAVMISAYFLPLRHGLITLVLSCLSFIFIFSTYRSHGHLDSAEILRLSVFIVSGATICYLMNRANKTNADLKDTLRRLENIEYAIDASSIVAITDNRGVIKYVNEQFCQISKYSEKELIGKTHKIINSGYHSKEFFRILWNTISSGHVWSGEILNRAKDGSHYWVSTVITPLLDEKGKPHEYIAIRNDITQQKQTEESMKNAIETRDRFMSIASHELKTPLTGMKLRLQLSIRQIERDGNLTPEKEISLVENTLKQVNSLERLVDDMLDISRINTGRLKYSLVETDLCALTKQVIENSKFMLQKYGTPVSVEATTPIIGHWDTQRLEQVLLNLLSNAARYGNKKPIKVVIGKDINWAYVSVIDQGIGIGEQDQQRIFQQFERAINHHEVSGLGLGLYISQKIIDAHKGKLIVESELGKGSNFTIYLPYKPQLSPPLQI